MALNPHLGNVFKRMIKEGIQEESKKQQGKCSKIADQQKKINNKTTVNKTQRGQNNDVSKVMKSPSDTTLYAPAFKKITSQDTSDSNEIIQCISNFVEEIRIGSNPSTPKGNNRNPK